MKLTMKLSPKYSSKAKPSLREIRYRLYRITGTGLNQYQIQVKYRDEKAYATFCAESLQHADQIYRKIVDGKVTPCTLNDVVQDLTG